MSIDFSIKESDEIDGVFIVEPSISVIKEEISGLLFTKTFVT